MHRPPPIRVSPVRRSSLGAFDDRYIPAARRRGHQGRRASSVHRGRTGHVRGQRRSGAQRLVDARHRRDEHGFFFEDAARGTDIGVRRHRAMRRRRTSADEFNVTRWIQWITWRVHAPRL